MEVLIKIKTLIRGTLFGIFHLICVGQFGLCLTHSSECKFQSVPYWKVLESVESLSNVFPRSLSNFYVVYQFYTG